MGPKKNNRSVRNGKNFSSFNRGGSKVPNCKPSVNKSDECDVSGTGLEDSKKEIESSQFKLDGLVSSLHSLGKDRKVEGRGNSLCSFLDPEVSLHISFTSSLPGNQCRLHASVFRKLKIEPGGIISFFDTSSNQEVVLEAFLSSVITSLSIEVSNDLSHLLEGLPSVVVKPLKLSFLPHLQLVVLSITLLGADSYQSEPIRDVVMALEWKSLFRQRFANTLIYLGMRTTLQNSLGTVLAEVVEAKWTEEELQNRNDSVSHFSFGMLSSKTSLLVSTEYIGPSAAKETADTLNATVAQHEKGRIAEHDFFPPSLCTNFSHMLVIGQEGTGKTFTLEEEARRHKAGGRFILLLEVESIASSEESRVSSPIVLHELFQRARCAAPSTVVADDLHLICHEASSTLGSSWAMSLLARSFVEELRSLQAAHADVCVLASAPSLDALHSILLSSSSFGNYIKKIDIPSSVEEKILCLRRCLVEVAGPASIPSTSSSAAVGDVALGGARLCHLSVEDCQKVVERTNGFTQRDFRRLVEHAVTTFFKRTCQLQCSAEELIESCRHIQPSTLREFDISIPDVTWEDIGGSENAKKVLGEVVEFALGKQKAIFQKYHLSPPRGVLLYGPPGCSKTMLAKALANESHLNFISVKGPEVFSKWVGDSEKAVRNIFSRARAAAPCVVFIDELDGMCGHRGQGGVSDRVISQFLTELDGLPSALSEKDHALIFVAATNRPDNIDGAVLRPGRIDKLVHVGLPSELERQKIAEIQFKRMPISPEMSSTYVASITEGYSGAEVVALIKEAALRAVSVSLAAEYLTKEDVIAASAKVRPRTKQEDVQWYLNWRHKG